KLGDSLRYGAMVSIIGASGTGKTILATTVCYSNALRGHPCLYASLQEFKDRFYKNFARLGFDLRELESRGLFKFVTLTIPGTSEIVEELVSMLENEVIAGKTRVLVIDSLTPLLRAIRDNVSGRAFLQNNLYTLSKLLNGLLVITLEETGADETMRADVEHVSDIVIHLRAESNKRLLTRFASLIKTRGAQIFPVEIPFTIEEGRGIKFWHLTLIKEIPNPLESKLLFPCRTLGDSVKEASLNSVVSLVSTTRPVPLTEIVTLIYATMLLNNLNKVLIFSYMLPTKKIIDEFRKAASGDEVVSEAINKLITDKILVKSLNPSSMTLQELYGEELNTIREYNPDAVVFLDTQVPEAIHARENPIEYIKLLRDQALYSKQSGRLLIRFSNYSSEEFIKSLQLISDVTIILDKEKVIIQTSYGSSFEIPAEAFRNCLIECRDLIRKQKI
ncbi:MAG: ATPase domain-containing protein, partial [Zestosphaera sp.]